uniref:SUEL-type lectin domain-containing protein n=1 Tax=Strongyloides venezuelensis TaxID=75913 RepID=A0A0K0FGS9_STRVS
METRQILASAVICIATLSSNNTLNIKNDGMTFNIECTINGILNHTFYDASSFNDKNTIDYKCLFDGISSLFINKHVICISQQVKIYYCTFLYLKTNDPCGEGGSDCEKAVVECYKDIDIQGINENDNDLLYNDLDYYVNDVGWKKNYVLFGWGIKRESKFESGM